MHRKKKVQQGEIQTFTAVNLFQNQQHKTAEKLEDLMGKRYSR